jgi:dTDP-4-dehydrorhamnose 3,5-epimerase
MKLLETPIAGVSVAVSPVTTDHRGAFSRLYCEREMAPAIADRRIVQINLSRTRAVGAIRGLHFQRPPHAEWKQVRCLKGRVWDVVVDLRAGSPSFLKWHAEELTPENGRSLVIPEGCAHGFQVLDADSELLYLHTAFYAPEAEAGVLYSDPTLAISWPLTISDVSTRDQNHPPITSDFRGISI